MHRYTLTDEKLNDPIKDAVRKQRRNRALLQSEEALRQAHGQRPPTNVAGRPVVYRQRTFPDATPHYRAASTLGGERRLHRTPVWRTVPRPSGTRLAGKAQDVLA